MKKNKKPIENGHFLFSPYDVAAVDLADTSHLGAP